MASMTEGPKGSFCVCSLCITACSACLQRYMWINQFMSIYLERWINDYMIHSTLIITEEG